MIRDLPGIQEDILNNVAQYVRPGGVLLYSTCTLRREENEAVSERFLQNHPGFSLEAFTLPGPVGEVTEGQCTLWPQRIGTDGFFIARFRRKGEGSGG